MPFSILLPALSTDHNGLGSAITHPEHAPGKTLENQHLSSTLLRGHGLGGPTLLPILFHRKELLKLGVEEPPALWKRAQAAKIAKIGSASLPTALLLRAPQ